MEYTGAGIITTFKIKYDGAEIEDYHNAHINIPRDMTIGQLMPQEICECSLARRNASTCIRPMIVEKIAKKLGIATEQIRNTEEIMRSLMRKTGCTSEKCVLTAAKNMSALSLAEAGIEEQIAFKQSGPLDASLFNDSVIQAQIYAWMYNFRDFWAYNFNMLNYAEKSLRHGQVMDEPDTLATIHWTDLYAGRVPMPVGMKMTPAAQSMIKMKEKGIRRSGCVINSDTYDGNGKHWMALFVDASAPEGPWTIEFFNSAAVRPESEWLEWMARTRLELQKCAASEATPPRKIEVETLCICKIWHQHSKSECGPYSLFYIWARLNGIPAKYFMENVVPDQIMFEFRQHLFNSEKIDPRGGSSDLPKIGETFDFSRFAQGVKIRWDTEDIAGNKKRTNI